MQRPSTKKEIPFLMKFTQIVQGKTSPSPKARTLHARVQIAN
jgi:hypothetical protein